MAERTEKTKDLSGGEFHVLHVVVNPRLTDYDLTILEEIRRKKYPGEDVSLETILGEGLYGYIQVCKDNVIDGWAKSLADEKIKP